MSYHLLPTRPKKRSAHELADWLPASVTVPRIEDQVGKCHPPRVKPRAGAARMNGGVPRDRAVFV